MSNPVRVSSERPFGHLSAVAPDRLGASLTFPSDGSTCANPSPHVVHGHQNRRADRCRIPHLGRRHLRDEISRSDEASRL